MGSILLSVFLKKHKSPSTRIAEAIDIESIRRNGFAVTPILFWVILWALGIAAIAAIALLAFR